MRELSCFRPLAPARATVSSAARLYIYEPLPAPSFAHRHVHGHWHLPCERRSRARGRRCRSAMSADTKVPARSLWSCGALSGTTAIGKWMYPVNSNWGPMKQEYKCADAHTVADASRDYEKLRSRGFYETLYSVRCKRRRARGGCASLRWWLRY